MAQPAVDFPRAFGKYNLLRPLATGGMAEVFLAQMSGHVGFDKACVVKRVLPTYAANTTYMQMFLDEARVIARLSHPNVVQVFDMGQVGDDYFMAMEYVPGADLQDILDALPADARRVPIPVACRIIAQVAEGLDHAHRAVDHEQQQLGIVHRDVSPSNVIVSVDGVAKICDFGIAKFGAQSSKTEVGSLKGKIHYMSPEQVRGDKVDARSDLFSLGVVLYEITVGLRPFEGTNPAEIAIKILNDDPVPPDLVIERYPRELWAVVQRLMAKRPQDRFSTARELQVALDGLLIAWSIRASSHEVAAYLEATMPGIGQRARATSALAATPTPTDRRQSDRRSVVSPLALDATREVRPFSGSVDLAFGSDGVPQSLELGNLSEELNVPPRRDAEGGSRAGYAIVAIVLVVGGGFWWITRNASTPPAEPSAISAPATPTPPTATPPTATPPTVAANQPAPKIDARPEPKIEVKPLDVPKPLEVRAEPPAKPEAPAKPEPTKTESHHHHSHSEAKPTSEGPRELPRLPSPPPAAEEPDTQPEQ